MMERSQRTDDLELDEDWKHQKFEWAVERFSWTLFPVLLFLALLGLFGPGPLSRAMEISPDHSLHITFERFLHYGDERPLQIEVKEGGTQSEEFTLSIDKQYFEAVEVRNVIPPPTRVHAAENEVVVTFKTASPGKPASIYIHMMPIRSGKLEGVLKLNGHSEVRLKHFIYP